MIHQSKHSRDNTAHVQFKSKMQGREQMGQEFVGKHKGRKRNGTARDQRQMWEAQTIPNEIVLNFKPPMAQGCEAIRENRKEKQGKGRRRSWSKGRNNAQKLTASCGFRVERCMQHATRDNLPDVEESQNVLSMQREKCRYAGETDEWAEGNAGAEGRSMAHADGPSLMTVLKWYPLNHQNIVASCRYVYNW